MSQGSSTVHVGQQQHRPWEKLATLVAWVSGAALFLTVGWMAMEPDDPQGPISLIAQRGGLVVLVSAALLAAVVGGLATVIAGRRLTDIGPFAAALGMGAVTLRGATAEHLLVQAADSAGSSQRVLAFQFVAESIAWLSVFVFVICICAIVVRWCRGNQDSESASGKTEQAGEWPIAAGFDVPVVGVAWFGATASKQSGLAFGIRHALYVAGVGLAVMAILSAGLSGRAIQHGQVCFIVAASVFCGTYVAFRQAPVRSALWSMLGVGVMAIAGYSWAVLRSAETGLPPNIPTSHFLRILPIQFIAVGIASAVVSYWHIYEPFRHDTDRSHRT